MELQTADARHEKTWHQFLSELEKPKIRNYHPIHD